MPTPVPELIALELVDRLEEITVANGYAFDVAAVVRPDRRGAEVKYQHLSILLEQGTSQRQPDLDYPGNPPAVAYDLEFSIKCIVRDSAGTTVAHASNENDMAAAVVKAITATGNDWYTLDGNAVIAELGSHDPFRSENGEFNGVAIGLSVTYRVAENDPFTVRA